MPKNKRKKIQILSLFTGAGGLDIGFHNAGFEAIAYNEIDARFCKTLTKNPKYFSSGKIINKDVRKLKTNEIPGKVEFIIGGPPCQSFSASGKRLGLNDDRGTLYTHYIRLLKHFKPKGFLFENVRGILYANKGKAIEAIMNDFRNAGYKVKYKLLNAADYGVPQLRERVFIMGSRLDQPEFFYPAPSHGPDSKSDKSYTTVWETIKDVYNPKEKVKPYNGKYGDLLPLVPEGQNYHYFTERMGYPNPKFGWRTKFSNFLYKVDRHQPCRTIQAQAGKYSGPFHWKNRKMTVEELIRLQTFPKDFYFPGGQTVAFHQIGNSVPPLIAEKIAKVLYEILIYKKISNNKIISDDFKFSFDKVKGDLAKKTREIGKKNLAKKNNQVSIFD